MSIIPANPPRPQGIRPPENQKQKRHSRKTKKYYGETAWETLRLVHATWLLALITIGVLGIGIYQIALTQNALELTRMALTNANISDSLQRIKDSLQSLQSQKAIVTQDAFQRGILDSTGTQIGISKETMQNDLRAYITIIPRQPVILNDTLDAKFYLQNRGKTPADSVKWWGHLMYGKSIPSDDSFQKYGADLRKLPPIFQFMVGDFGSEDHIYFPIDMRRLKSRDNFYIYGEILYKDIFGKQHKTGFRMVWYSDGNNLTHYSYLKEGNYEE